MSTRNAVVRGLGGALPRRVITNEDLSVTLDTSDEWIRRRTGIVERRHADESESTSALATTAARRALDSAGVDSADLLILATSTPDQICPATAPKVAANLGLDGIAAYDISAVCSGYIYALATASWAIGSGAVGSALVVGADTFTRLLDPADRTTSVIFGDGAGAAFLSAGSADEPGAILASTLHADGTGETLIQVPRGAGSFFEMQGKEVFERAVSAMSDSVNTVLARVGWATEDVDSLVAHQANRRILNTVASVTGIPESKAEVHLDRVGNTSAASIPLAMTDAAVKGHRTPGDKAVLTAFGGGTTWGAAAMTWPSISVLDPH
ncbi:beta-ketoacyl-ACP synthase III [Zhihengliuella salsuginis]|uniref:Beta-ketoacyl-[acyl-carrier-protein] synthase III n=1 Tax=Zhihengliuella salsuginis TaxID=578222 RepID=A0ABQ3GGV3_9MICC|nr:beta-ketoacyl-ACP synthase III [Zhihengliuella salsuginis]GHD05033.1 3-oxoacyl-[acyl-carrier-protein] synthase 3 protein 5 [Zhihengliuella salsuginis]